MACAVNGDVLQATAFINADDTVAVVVLNFSDEARDYKVWIAGKLISAHSPAHSIETVITGS